MKKKISQVLFSGLGGHGSVVFSMIGADREKKWENALLFYGNQPVKEEYTSNCNSLGIRYNSILKRKGIKDYLRAYHYLKRQRPDIVFLHVPTLILVAWWYCLVYRRKLVLIEHNANQIKRKGEWICTWLGMWLANRIVYLTENYADEVRQRLGKNYRSKKVRVIPNGIDLNLFQPAKNKANRELIISMISRFSFSKDHETLVRAFAALQNDTGQVYLHLPGDGETLPAVKKLAEELKAERIIFPGMLTEIEVAELIKKTDIYVMATWGETMNTSIMQAMACAIPVLASDVRGIVNVVDGRNGWLYASRDAKDLEKKLKMLIESEELRNEIGNVGHKYAKQHFSQQKMFNEYNTLAASL